MKKGLFISFEGSDGAGKSTQIDRAANFFESKGYEVVRTREPGGTPISEKIRKIILDNNNKEMSFMTEALLYAASRAQHVREVIQPAIDAGKVVVCDRYVHSSLVYQGYARGLGVENVKAINDFAIDGVMPDLSIFILLPVEVAMDRLKNSGKVLDRLEVEGMDFFKRVETAFADLAQDNDKIVVVDATKSVDEMADTIKCKLVELVNNYERN